MTKYDIYGIGAALVDTEIEVSDTDLTLLNLNKGVMTLVDQEQQIKLVGALKGHLVTSKRASGGSGANSIIAASYFGSKTFYSCKVAHDENGNFYLNDLSNAGVTYSHQNHESSGITGKCLVMITPDAERTMTTFLGISETLSTAQIDPEALSQSQYVYIEGYLVTSPTGKAAAIETRRLAQEHRVKVAISLSDPGIVEFFRAGLLDIMGKRVDLIFCNEHEALQFTQTDTIDAAITQLKEYSDCFAITRGARSSVIFDGQTLHEVPCQQVKAIDTNGAGDMFAGAFLSAISQGQSYYDAGAFANQAASVIVSQFGPRLRAEQYADLIKVSCQP